MTAAPGEGDETGKTGESDDLPTSRRACRLLLRGVRWLREFNRGYATTGHLPNRKK